MSGAQSIFTVQGEGRFMPTELARGPWDPNALHGGAAAALIVQELERLHPTPELRTGRLSFQFLRPVPRRPLDLSTALVRPGRRVQELAAELRDGETLVCRAKALRVQALAAEIPEPEGDRSRDQPMRGPQDGNAVRFALDDPEQPSFATSMEMRWLSDPYALGPGQVWMRLRAPLLPDAPAIPLALLAAVCDFGNGVSSELRFDRYMFINADLSLHLRRAPLGEWAGIDARTLLAPDGAGLSESVAHDAQGAVGRAFQTLVVQPR